MKGLFRLAVLFGAAACAALSCPAAAHVPGTLRIGAEVDFPPYSFLDEAGRPAGYSVDLIKAAADAMGLKVAFSTGTWEQVWDGLRKGRLDALPIVARNKSREGEVNFSIQHTETFDAFFTRAGDPHFHSLAEAEGRSVVVMRADAAHQELLARGFKGVIVETDTISAGLSLVASGKYDAVLCPKIIGTLVLGKSGLKGLRSGPPLPEYKRAFSFAVGKGDADLLEKLNEGLLIIRTNGEYERIYEKWLGGEDIPWHKRVRPFLYGISLVSALALLLGLWTLALRRQVKRRTRELEDLNRVLAGERGHLEERVERRTRELNKANEALATAHRGEELGRRRLQAILDTSPMAVVLLEAGSGELRYINRSAREIYGTDYSGAPLYGHISLVKARRLDGTPFPQEELPGVRALKGEEVRGVEMIIDRPDGGQVFLAVSAAPVREEDGAIRTAVVILDDITGHRRAEEERNQLEKKYRDLFMNMTEEVHVWELVRGADGGIKTWRLVDMNPPAERSWGSSAGKMRGKTADEVLGEGSVEHYMPIVRKIMAEGRAYSYEDYFPNLDRHFRFTSVPMGDYFFTTGSDITGIKIAEKLLQETNEDLERRVAEQTLEIRRGYEAVRGERQRFLDMLETLPVVLALLRPDYRIEWVNSSYRKALGENLGKVCHSSQFGREKPCEECQAFTPLRTGGPHKWEWTMPDGRTFDIHNFPFTDSSGATMILEMLVDVTAQKRAVKDLLEARLELERFKRLSDIGTLAATVAHELRNPLAAIGMAARNIRHKANNPDLERHLANIHKKVAESDQIITNLLFYSRLRPPQFERLSLLPLLAETVEAAREKSKKAVTAELAAPAADGLLVEGDPVQLKEVFNNILDNSFDAAPAEGGSVRIEVADAGGKVAVRVTDNGPGIPPEAIGKIFDPFFTTKARGTGLGLSVCRQIVDMHEGSIDVSSETGRGTRVDVSIPKTRKDRLPHFQAPQ
jgi:PAS domain S-box-containing protein